MHMPCMAWRGMHVALLHAVRVDGACQWCACCTCCQLCFQQQAIVRKLLPVHQHMQSLNLQEQRLEPCHITLTALGVLQLQLCCLQSCCQALAGLCAGAPADIAMSCRRMISIVMSELLSCCNNCD